MAAGMPGGRRPLVEKQKMAGSASGGVGPEHVLVRSPLLTSHKWRELISSRRLVCICHDVFLWCYLCIVLLRFRLDAFIEAAAALLSIVLRYAGAR